MLSKKFKLSKPISLNLSFIASVLFKLKIILFNFEDGMMSKLVTTKRVLKNYIQCEGNLRVIKGERTEIWREFINPQRRFIEAPRRRLSP